MFVLRNDPTDLIQTRKPPLTFTKTEVDNGSKNTLQTLPSSNRTNDSWVQNGVTTVCVQSNIWWMFLGLEPLGACA